jgi:hypothetical protein
MKMKMELKQRKEGGYELTIDKPAIVCYGETIKAVFLNLKKAFITLERLNQLGELNANNKR